MSTSYENLMQHIVAIPAGGEKEKGTGSSQKKKRSTLQQSKEHQQTFFERSKQATLLMVDSILTLYLEMSDEHIVSLREGCETQYDLSSGQKATSPQSLNLLP